MIARTWGGKVPVAYASDFRRHLMETGLQDYQRQSGCREIRILRRDSDGWAHFLLFSIWQSWDAIRAYAGDNPDRAVLYPDDERYGLVPNLVVNHHEVDCLTVVDATASDESRSLATVGRDSYDSKRLATPVGPFSHACHSTDLVFLSGQVGQHPDTGQLVDGGAAAQAKQILVNLGALLADRGLAADYIVKVNIFLLDMAEFAAVNGVYRQHFAPPFPARTTVAVKALPMGAAVEMEAVARKS